MNFADSLRKAALSLALILGLNLTEAPAAERVEAPAWALPLPEVDLTQSPPADVEDGLFDLLLDRQTHWQDGIETVLTTHWRQITNRQGLEAAGALDMTFDPQIGTLGVHRIRILHEGVWQDLTDETTFEELRRETGLNDGIIDGEITYFAHVPSLSVGDIVEFSKVRTYRHPIFASGFADRDSMDYSVPVGVLRKSLLAPEDIQLEIKSVGDVPDPTITSEGGMTRYVWASQNLRARYGEAQVPEEHQQWSELSVSTWDGWQAITTALLPHYAPASLPDGQLASEIRKIAGTYGKPEIKASMVSRLIQDQVRYVGLEMGVGGYVPRKPDEVLATGFGDCKDKALLLVSALATLDIPAHVALVHSQRGHGLPDLLPSPYVFNHAIVVADIEGKDLWLDPTSSNQGGMGFKVPIDDFGYALVLDAKTDGLTKLPDVDPRQSSMQVEEVFSFPKEPGDSLKLTVTTTYTGRQADDFRERMASVSKRKMEETWHRYYNGLYPGIAIRDPSMRFDLRDQNQITTKEYYTLDYDTLRSGSLLDEFPMRGDAVATVLTEINSLDRKAPYLVGEVGRYTHRVSLETSLIKIEAVDPVSLTSEAATFTSTSVSTSSGLTFDWVLQVNKRSAAAESLGEHQSLRDGVRDAAWENYDLSGLSHRLDQKAAGTDYLSTDPSAGAATEPAVLAILGAIVIASLLLLGLSLRSGLRGDRDYRDQAISYPVSPVKFIILGLLTLGLYPWFWFLKFWLWEKRNGRPRILPAWRAIFMLFWLIPAMNAVYRRTPDRTPQIHRIFALLATALLFASYFSGSLLNGHGSGAKMALGSALMLAGGLSPLPILLGVNRLNDPLAEPYRRNSRFTAWNIVGILLGSLVLGLYAAGLIWT